MNKNPEQPQPNTPQHKATTKQKAEDSKKPPSQQTTDQEKPTDWKDKYLRLYAEFDNYKKRTAKQQLSWISTANEALITELLPIIEDFERALNNTENNQIPQKGIQLIHDKFIKTLTTQGLNPIPIKQGDIFDPDHHEALTTMPTQDEKLKGKILQIVNKGYTLNKKTIKIAKVIIGK